MSKSESESALFERGPTSDFSCESFGSSDLLSRILVAD